MMHEEHVPETDRNKQNKKNSCRDILDFRFRSFPVHNTVIQASSYEKYGDVFKNTAGA